jgi:hypothetical protein
MTNLLTKIVALGALVLLLGASHSLAADAQVKIANFTFDPPTLTVKAGTTVTWSTLMIFLMSFRRRTARSARALSIRTIPSPKPSRRQAPSNIFAPSIRI